MAITTVISSKKGGQGKTALTLNLSGFAGKTKRVLCIEIDIQKNMSLILQDEEVYQAYTIYDVLTGAVDTKEAILPSVFKGVDYIPGSGKLRDLSVDTTTITKILDSVQAEYDLIFIDCPPNINSLVESSYISSDLVVTPIELELFSLSNVTELIDTVKAHNSKAEIVLVPNKVVGRSKLNRTVKEHLNEIVDYYDNVRIGTELPNSIQISNLMIDNKLLINSMMTNPLKKALKKLYKELYK